MVNIISAPIEDKGSSKCRVSHSVLSLFNLKVGQWVKISTPIGYCVCKAWPQQHDSKDIIQVDPAITSISRDELLSEIVEATSFDALKSILPADSISLRLPKKKNDFTNAQQLLMQNSMFGFVCKAECTITVDNYKLKVLDTSPHDFVMITPNTRFVFEDPIIEQILIGGLENVIHSLTEMLIYPLQYPQDFEDLGIEPPKGVLLYGPPGCGKTLVVRKVAHDSKLPLIYIDAPQIIGAYIGESEENIRKEFAKAEELAIIHGACIMFIDEIDALQETRGVVGQLLTLMDGVKKRGRVIVVAATNRPHMLDPAMRRPGRLDREIEINVPNLKSRQQILQVHSKKLPLHQDEISEMCAGYVGADLSALCREAALHALRRTAQTKSEPCVAQQDFLEAIKILPPSTLKGSIVDDIPKTTWQDIGGLEDVKQQLIAAVEWPLRHRDTYTKLGLHPPRGLLLHGPPGCAKTTLVKAVANSCKATFLTLPSATIFSPYLGDAERTVRDAFRMARRARPSIASYLLLYAIVAKREIGTQGGQGGGEGVQSRVLSTMLNEMDGIEQAEGILVIGATNRLDMIDPALIRPGRFDKVLSVPPPDMESRKQILQIHTKHMPIAPDVDIQYFAQMCNIFTGAELENMCREAAFIALRENFNSSIVMKSHFLKAYEVVRQTIKRTPPANNTFQFAPPTK